MTAAQLYEVMDILRWSPNILSDATDIRLTTIRRWRSGEQPVPEPIAAWLRGLAAFHRENPPPAPPRLP